MRARCSEREASGGNLDSPSSFIAFEDDLEEEAIGWERARERGRGTEREKEGLRIS